MRSASLEKLGQLVERAATWNPARDAAGRTIRYIDLGAVDNDSKTIRTPQAIEAENAPSRARQLIKEGDILVSTVRPNLNGVARVRSELDGATASTGFCVLRPGRHLDAGYLFQWVKSPLFVAAMVARAFGQSYPAVSDRIIYESEIPLPPLDEQRRIAAILDQADAVRRKRKLSLARIRSASDHFINDAFGDPIRNEKRFPVVALGDLVDAQRPVTYGILKPGEDTADGVPYVRVVDIKEGWVASGQLRRTRKEIAHQYRRSTLREGDLLISIRGHVGRMAFVTPESRGANITQDTARLAITGANPRYVRGALEHGSGQRWMGDHTRGIAVQGINLGDLKRFPVVMPPSGEQEIRAGYVSARRGRAIWIDSAR